MKKIFTLAILICTAVAGVFAQKQGDPLPYNKEMLDSMFRSFPKPTAIGANSFELNNPGATILNKTSRGTVYNIQLDNMPVLVPDMQAVEKMPVAELHSGDKMPNPLKKEKKY